MKTRNKKLSIALIASSSLITMSNVDANDGGLYAGVVYGTTTVNTGVTNTTGSAKLDESGTGYKLLIGKPTSKNLALEVFYADFGEATLTGNAGDNATFKGTPYVFLYNNTQIVDSAKGLGFNANFIHDFSKKSSIIGRLGILRWDYNETTTATGYAGSSTDKSGTDVFYSIGYRYAFTKATALAVDYDIYKINSENVDMMSIGVQFKF